MLPDRPPRAGRTVHRVGDGAGGFLGSRLGYADGHGGNVGMRELAAQADAYEVSILEVMGSAAAVDEVYDAESAWKLKLGTRARGLRGT